MNQSFTSQAKQFLRGDSGRYTSFMVAKYAAAALQFVLVTVLSIVDKYTLADYGVYKVVISYFPYLVLGQASIYTIDLAQSFTKEKLAPNLGVLLITSGIVSIILLSLWTYLDVDCELWMILAVITAIARVAGMLALADARLLEDMRFINSYYLIPPTVLLSAVLSGLADIFWLVLLDGLSVITLLIAFLTVGKYQLRWSCQAILAAYKTMFGRWDLMLFLAAHYGVSSLYKLLMRSHLDDMAFADFTFSVSIVDGVLLAASALGFLFFTEFIGNDHKKREFQVKRVFFESVVCVSMVLVSIILLILRNGWSSGLDYCFVASFVLLLFYKETITQKEKYRILIPSIVLLCGLGVALVLGDNLVFVVVLAGYYLSLSYASRDHWLEDLLVLAALFAGHAAILCLVALVVVKLLRYRKFRMS